MEIAKVVLGATTPAQDAAAAAEGLVLAAVDGLEPNGEPPVAERNRVRDPSFEGTDASVWTIAGEGASIGATGDAADGDRALSFWLDGDYSGSVSQVITGVPAGSYVLAATTQGGDSKPGDVLELSATVRTGPANPGTDRATDASMGRESSGQERAGRRSTIAVPMELAGWREFRTASTEAFTVGERTEVTVALTWSLSAGAWGTFDDVRLVRVGD